MNLAKKTYRYTYEKAADVKSRFSDADVSSTKLDKAIEKVCKVYNVCASKSKPHFMKKLAITQVSDGFNNEIQADFVTERNQEHNYEVLNILHLGTR